MTSSGSSASPVIARAPLGHPWPGIDPFLFCAHHLDAYPAGNGALGPAATELAGREIGMDFSRRDGWSMYHGETVPGFPGHPHRGFETITIVRQGLVDHADSLGATARYGDGDVQWLTAGSGIQHAEMFPLVATDGPNPLDLYQIWLNLPSDSKMVAPAFRMLWEPTVPRVSRRDDQGRESEVLVIAGDYAPLDDGHGDAAAPDLPAIRAPAPPPDSWASQAQADVAIWLIRLQPGASLTLPPAHGSQSRRVLYFHQGSRLVVASERIDGHEVIEVSAGRSLPLRNDGSDEITVLMLQGRPIGEPVAARGPFVMNTQQELAEAYRDYSRTRFGGWPWPGDGHTHGTQGRFARFPDGRTETP